MGVRAEVRFNSHEEVEKDEDDILDELDQYGEITYTEGNLKVIEIEREGNYGIDVDAINKSMEKYGGKAVVNGTFTDWRHKTKHRGERVV